jgi:hypothetical protein
MRDDRLATSGRLSARLWFVLGTLIGWLVIQNALLFLMWSLPVWPAVGSVAQALVKVGGMLAPPVMPAALVVGGAGWLWVAYRRTSPPKSRCLGEVRHG